MHVLKDILLGVLPASHSHLRATERSWGRSLPWASTSCQLPRLSSLPLSDRREGTRVNRFPWGRRIRGNVRRPEGEQERGWLGLISHDEQGRLREETVQRESTTRKHRRPGRVDRLTFTVVLMMQGDMVPTRIGASFPCHPVIHMILPVWKQRPKKVKGQQDYSVI